MFEKNVFCLLLFKPRNLQILCNVRLYVALTAPCCSLFYSTEINEFHQDSQLISEKLLKLIIVLTKICFLFQENKNAFLFWVYEETFWYLDNAHFCRPEPVNK
jgi:hypothetical protein